MDPYEVVVLSDTRLEARVYIKSALLSEYIGVVARSLNELTHTAMLTTMPTKCKSYRTRGKAQNLNKPSWVSISGKDNMSNGIVQG